MNEMRMLKEVNSTDNLIEFAKEQCEIFPEDSAMGRYLRETLNMLQAEPCEEAVSREEIYFKLTNGAYSNETIEQFIDRLVKELEDIPPVKPTRKKCKWILYDYRTLVPREHGNIPNPYWRIPARYRTELRYCPYCGREIDYSEVDAEIEKRGSEE